MKFNKKYVLALPAMAIAGVVIATSVSAAGNGGFGGHGEPGMGGGPIQDPDRFVEHVTQEASVLGITVEEMKAYWAQGKTVQEIATEKGLTKEQLQTKMEAVREAKMTASIKVLVDKGIITQAQADTRLAAMKNLKAKMSEQMKNKMQKRGGKPGVVQKTMAQ